jgi:hypothetical protein
MERRDARRGASLHPEVLRRWSLFKTGGKPDQRELFDAVMEDIILLSRRIRVVLVHGGGPEISAMLKRIGKESRFVNGLRYTDAETMEIVQGVLCGKVNKDLVATLIRKGGRAIGLCGIDGSLIEAKKMAREDGEDYGLVGDIRRSIPSVVFKALGGQYDPRRGDRGDLRRSDTSYNIIAERRPPDSPSRRRGKLIILPTRAACCATRRTIRTLIMSLKTPTARTADGRDDTGRHDPSSSAVRGDRVTASGARTFWDGTRPHTSSSRCSPTGRGTMTIRRPIKKNL